MCQGEFLKKDEYQEWELYENLAKKIQQEPFSDKSKNQNPITFKTELDSIESFIAAEAKITHLMRTLELLEPKE